MKFSVLMAVYHKEEPEYLKQALQSLDNQTLKADEVVLVEDGSIGEELITVIEAYRKSLNIISVKLETNNGLAVALNEGLKYCKHELVARMDSDDISLPQRFEKQVKYMTDNPDIAVSSAWLEEIDQNEQIISIRKLPVEHSELKKFAKTRSPVSHPVVIFRKSLVLSVGGYPLFRKSQDYALWSVMLNKDFLFTNIGEVLLKMRAGDYMMSRRGYSHLKHELRIVFFQKKIGFINWFHFLKNVLIRSILRLSPGIIKKLLYRYARVA